MRWDYVSANNGMGFHAPQECTRILGTSIDLAQQVRLGAARLMARFGISTPPRYPDLSTRKAVAAWVAEFEAAAAKPGSPVPALLQGTPRTPAAPDPAAPAPGASPAPPLATPPPVPTRPATGH
jgi:hypothetical protein